MEFKKLRELVEKYHSGKASEAERALVEAWYASFSVSPQEDPLEDSVHAEAIKDQIWRQLSLEDSPKKLFSFSKKQLMSVTAAAILLLTGIWMIIDTERSSFHSVPSKYRYLSEAYATETGVRERKHITLPDSSQVWLNANSTLRILPRYGDSSRRIALSGEAFFDVKPDPNNPFIVETEQLNVQVLGTAFNVNSYDHLKSVGVHVEHGVVAVSHRHEELCKLTDGEGLVYEKLQQKLVRLKQADIGSWRDGKVVLEQASFEEVAQVLFNMYGVRLKASKKVAQGSSYNLSLYAKHSLQDNLDIICGIHRLNYRRENDEIILY